MARQYYLFGKAIALLAVGFHVMLALEDGILGGVVGALTGGGAGLIAAQLMGWDRRRNVA